MSLQLGPALRRGAGHLLSRAGLAVLAAYTVVMLVYQLSFNTLLRSLVTGLLPPGAPAGTVPNLVTLPVPDAVAGVLVVVALLAAATVTVVAVRTFVAGERERVPRRFLTDRMVFAVANVAVGGIAFGLVVFLGTLLLVVPGVVAYVGLLFMLQYVAAEDENFVTAMRRSWRLTKGNRIRLFLLVLVLLGVVFVVTFLVNVVLGTALGVAFGAGTSGLVSLAVGTVNVVSTLYLLAVLSDAFVQLRDGPGPESRGTRPPTGTLGA
ncbi:glycerophosphoryl diester phosphodiesterase membrane domain-containing protein [Salinigranum sp.]|uniref:glycerophosphoryl diester phosphodiesterase membrane domain-containing protein n=1 Tax=Salinigranum sp. TaxID=1966351 RepID=UPI003569EBFF